LGQNPGGGRGRLCSQVFGHRSRPGGDPIGRRSRWGGCQLRKFREQPFGKFLGKFLGSRFVRLGEQGFQGSRGGKFFNHLLDRFVCDWRQRDDCLRLFGFERGIRGLFKPREIIGGDQDATFESSDHRLRFGQVPFRGEFGLQRGACESRKGFRVAGALGWREWFAVLNLEIDGKAGATAIEGGQAQSFLPLGGGFKQGSPSGTRDRTWHGQPDGKLREQ